MKPVCVNSLARDASTDKNKHLTSPTSTSTWKQNSMFFELIALMTS